MDNDKFKNLLGSLGQFAISKIEPVISYDAFNPNRKEYHTPEEILGVDSDEFERPDFSDWKCKICVESIEDVYFWYYLMYERDESKSVTVCPKECLDKLVKIGELKKCWKKI